MKKQMDLLEKQSRYYAFLSEHRDAITDELRAAYAQFREYPIPSIIGTTDFGGFVGIPLFFLGSLWVYSSSKISQWIIFALIVGFGFWLRYWQKHVIDIACRHFFWNKRKEILESYLERCKTCAIQQAAGGDAYILDDLFAYYKKEILSEKFRYYGNEPFNKRC